MIIRLPKPEKRSRKPRSPIRRRFARRQPAALAEHRQLEKEADRIWSVIIRAQAPRCQRCNLRPVHDAHHMISRSYRQTRWILSVGAALCRNCHRIVGMDGEENRLLAVRLIGVERWEQLNIAKHCRAKIDPKIAAIVLWNELWRRELLPLL